MFEHLKVVELASVLAGPLVGSFFAELGAEVIKFENKKVGGDVTRQWKLPQEDPESSISAYYAAANFGKSIMMADLKNQVDYDTVVNYIKEADVLILNFKAGSAEKLNLDFESVKKINHHIIYASLTGYGEENPRPAFDMILQAESGFMSMTGEADGPPCKIPVAIIDVLAAHHLKEAILCAMIKQQKDRVACEINISLYEAALASLVNQATNYLMAGHTPGRMGSQHPNIAPYGDSFQTFDGKYLILGIGTDKQFESLKELLNLPPDKFDKNTQRLKSRAELCRLIQLEVAKHELSYWVNEFKKYDIPFSPVYTVPEALETDQARECLIECDIEGHKTIRPRTALI